MHSTSDSDENHGDHDLCRPPPFSLTCGHVDRLYVVFKGLDDVGDVLHAHLTRCRYNHDITQNEGGSEIQQKRRR